MKKLHFDTMKEAFEYISTHRNKLIGELTPESFVNDSFIKAIMSVPLDNIKPMEEIKIIE